MSVVLLESEDVAWFRDNLTGARGAASRLAERIGMNQHRAGEVALAMSEAASNLVKHAVARAIMLRIARTGQHAGIEFRALDDGPGMADAATAILDRLLRHCDVISINGPSYRLKNRLAAIARDTDAA